MEPTLHDGDRLLIRYAATPTAGRVAVVRLPPEADGTSRPVAVKRLSRPVDDGWWVERDNPSEGVDSWLLGAIPGTDVVAVVVARLWPRPSLLRRPPRSGARDAEARPRG
jgi:hypothetical protein